MLKMLKEGEECGKAPAGQACSSDASGWIYNQQNMAIISSRVYVHIKMKMSITRLALVSCIMKLVFVLQMFTLCCMWACANP